MRGLALTCAALALAGAAAAAPPRQGVLVPGVRLGGVAPGMTVAQLTRAWGSRYGVCRGCPRTTWYFNFVPFAPQGLGVELSRGRVTAVFTLWGPDAWRTNRGLRIGDAPARITSLYGSLPRVECGHYSALTLRRGRRVTAFYVADDEVWAFGLLDAAAPVCR